MIFVICFHSFLKFTITKPIPPQTVSARTLIPITPEIQEYVDAMTVYLRSVTQLIGVSLFIRWYKD